MVLMMDAPPAAAQTFALVALILTAAMNATVTALVPATIYAASLPPALAVLALLRPTSVTENAAVLATLACGTLIYFMILGRRLYATALEGLSFQAEKDSLIVELEQAKSNSDLARHRAEEANLAKSRFLATMSHELRTPLNAILGFSEVMKGELFGAHAVASYKEYSDDIHSSGQHLLMLINEILDLSRVEAGRYELREESVALAHVVEDCRHLLTLRAKQRGLVISDAIEPSLPRIWADERAVRQVTLNLLSNAIKFTPQGGSITVKVGWTAAGGQYLSIRMPPYRPARCATPGCPTTAVGGWRGRRPGSGRCPGGRRWSRIRCAGPCSTAGSSARSCPPAHSWVSASSRGRRWVAGC